MNERELAKLTLAPDFKMEQALAVASPQAIEAAIAAHESTVPMGKLGTEAQKMAIDAVGKELSPIGAKLAPHMGSAQASAWKDATVTSLRKWPRKTVLLACKRALMERFPQGLGTVDARLHELCEEIEQRNALALQRLKKMRAEIDRAAQPSLPPPPDEPMSIEEIADMPESMRRLGVKAGFISDEELNKAMDLLEERRKSEQFDTEKNEA